MRGGKVDLAAFAAWESAHDQGRVSVASELLEWLDTRPMTSLETLVIELRQRLNDIVAKGVGR